MKITENKIKTLAKWIEESVEWLRKEDRGCCTCQLDNRLAVCVGWSDGFDPEDTTIIHSENEPTWAIVIGIKVWTSDDLRTDFDWISSPYYEDRDCEVFDTDYAISPDENYEFLAKDYLEEFHKMSNLIIAENGSIVKELPVNATIELCELDCDLDDEEAIKEAAIEYVSDEVGYCINYVESISLEDEGLVKLTGINWYKY